MSALAKSSETPVWTKQDGERTCSPAPLQRDKSKQCLTMCLWQKYDWLQYEFPLTTVHDMLRIKVKYLMANVSVCLHVWASVSSWLAIHNVLCSAKFPDLQSKVGETERSTMQVASLRSDLIPEELLATLTSAAHPYCKTECSKARRTSQACKVCVKQNYKYLIKRNLHSDTHLLNYFYFSINFLDTWPALPWCSVASSPGAQEIQVPAGPASFIDWSWQVWPEWIFEYVQLSFNCLAISK